MLHHFDAISVRNRAPAWLFIDPVLPQTQPMLDLFELIAQGDLEGLRAAVRRDPNVVTQRHSSGASVLAWAAYMGNVGAIAIIRAARDRLDPYEAIIVEDNARLAEALDEGFDVNSLSPDGFTPLALAAFFGNGVAFDLLLPRTRDVNVNADNPQRVAALHAATARRDARAVEALLKAGADPDLLQADDVTALHAAAMHGDTTIVGLLLLFGADPSLRNAKGKTAADFARDAGHGWLAKRLAR
ncbi:ankyrin repeat domain-containing protein [Devosia sp.]|uniref:ankyrin repeat domain-containing protein n=1 Tax=Devosia sp. TaxID=1871048 RepID=UPI003A941DB7